MADHDKPDFTETCIESRLAYEGRMLVVHEDTVHLPDGKSARREWVKHPGAVVMIALLDERTVLLERQFRYPLRRHFLELPAGKIESGEEPLATARRELQEECGYEASNWRHLATLHPCIGYSDEHIELFLARDLHRVTRQLDDGEFLEVVPMSVSDALDSVVRGEITDIKTVTGLFWLESINSAKQAVDQARR